MRKTIALTLAFLTIPAAGIARPLYVHVGVHGHARGHGTAAARVMIAEGILRGRDLRCTNVVRGHFGSARVEQVSLFQRHGGGCPGAPLRPTYMYDVYVDTVSGVVDYAPGKRMDLQTVLPGERITP